MALFIGTIIGGMWVLGKVLKKSKIEENINTLPSAPPAHQIVSKYITGKISDEVFGIEGTAIKRSNVFKNNGAVLIMSNVRISNIHVYNKDKKKVDGKIIIVCNDMEIFNEKMKDQWVDTHGILLHNAWIRIETKEKVPLEYTIYYTDVVIHQDINK